MKNKVKLLLTIFVFLIAISGCSSSNEKVTKNNVLDKLQGSWISKDFLKFDDLANEELHEYLIFKNESVLYTASFLKFQKVEVYSLSSMYFGNQNWIYEYVDDNTLVHGGNVYNRSSENDENVKYISNIENIESSFEQPLLTYSVNNLNEILKQNRYYLVGEYIKIQGFNSEKHYKQEVKGFSIDGYGLDFNKEINIVDEEKDVVCVASKMRKIFSDCIIIE